MTRILVIDDEQASCRTLKLHFEGRGFQVETAGAAEEGLALILAEPYDLVISDIRMPGRDGLSLLKDIQDQIPELPVIMITAFQDLDSTVAAMHGGAVDYVSKPIDLEVLEAAVDKVVTSSPDQLSDDIILSLNDKSEAIVGRSSGMQEVFKQIGIASRNRVNVFIDGEPGTGKTAVAKAIHNARFHSDQPFVTINCSSSTEVFLERELFGHEEDNHSGAEEERLGKVGLAGEGTLFIDKVNSLSPRLQDKLMRLLRENEYTPLGATRPLQTGCRFVLASDIDLVDEVAAGRFSKDLFYSLGVFSIFIPPLRDRKEDIPLLVERLITKINKEACKNITRIQSDCMGLLVDYDWTGNVRQLENALMKAVVVAPGDVLNVSLLPEEITGGGKVPFSDSELALGKTLKDLECEHIHAVLTATGWHKGKACEILGISRPRLDRRIAEFGFVRD